MWAHMLTVQQNSYMLYTVNQDHYCIDVVLQTASSVSGVGIVQESHGNKNFDLFFNDGYHQN